MRRPAAWAITVGLLLASAGCSDGTSKSAGGEPTAATSDVSKPPGGDPTAATPQVPKSPGGDSTTPNDSREPSPGGTSPPPTGSRAEELFLGRQVQLQQGGDGIGPQCVLDEDTPAGFRHDPGVWLNNLFSVTEYPGLTVLCLRGFSLEESIDVVVSVGDLRTRTAVHPTGGAPTEDTTLGYQEEPSATLFVDGADLRVYQVEELNPYGAAGPRGSLVSEMWTFLPPAGVRDRMAGRSVRITATQGARSASSDQLIPIPQKWANQVLSTPVGDRLVLIGYDAGSDVPVGLYRQTSASSEASLVRQVGFVTMPRSQVAEFPIPDGLLGGEFGSFCLLPPVDREAYCQHRDNWPGYPGPITLGDAGAAVNAWQDILIGAGVISDIPENHDGVYGPATQAAVNQFMKQRGFEKHDGPQSLGPSMYRLLTGREP
jgi:hypothetical protein